MTISTFKEQFYQDRRTSLAQSDIICVQEMTVNPSKLKSAEYLPFATEYGVVPNEEPSTGKFNAVYYNKGKFSEVANNCLDQAYKLMACKRECCDYIQQGRDTRIEKAIKGELKWGDSDADKKRMCQEVLQECREARTIKEFKTRILPKYRAPGEDETKDPSDLLNRRMAICVLKIKSLPEQHVVAISVHNYSGRSGGEAPENYASLLFDFLSKLHFTGLTFIVIVTGDFNLDINTKHSLTRYLHSYHIGCNYTLRPLRRGLNKIDFILATKPIMGARLEITVKEVQAHDLQVSDEVDDELKRSTNLKGQPLSHSDITNHNPVSAVIELNLKK